jgi:hypothetical protein
VQRAVVGVIGEQHRDIPARHRPVEHPTTGELDHVDHAGGHDVQPVPHVALGVGLDGEKSRTSASAYSLNTSARGIAFALGQQRLVGPNAGHEFLVESPG